MEELKQEVIKVGRRRFIFGMIWELPDRERGQTRGGLLSEANMYVQNMGGTYNVPLNMVALRSSKRSGDHAQYALCTKRSRVFGAMSAAGALVSKFNGSWILLVTIEEDVLWFLDVREDVIIHDIVFTDRASAMNMFTQSAVGDVRIFVDVDFAEQNQNFLPIDIFKVLSELKGPYVIPLVELPSFFDKGKRNKTALVMFGAIALFGLYKGYGMYQNHLRLLHNQQVAAQLRLNQQRDILNNRVVVPAPWVELDSISDFGAQCMFGWSHLPLSLPGYNLSTIECIPGQETAHFVLNTDGVPYWIRSLLHSYQSNGMKFDFNMTPDGKSVDVTFASKKLGHQSIDGLVDHVMMQQSFSDFYYLTRTNTQFNSESPIRATAPKSLEDKNNHPFILPWYTMPYSVTTSDFMPWLSLLSSIPGLSLHDIVYHVDKKEWTFTGIGYSR